MFPIAGTNEELDLGEERLKVGGVWHGELHKSNREEESSSDHQETFMQHKKHLKKTFVMLDLNENVQLHILKRIQLATLDFDIKKIFLYIWLFKCFIFHAGKALVIYIERGIIFHQLCYTKLLDVSATGNSETA